MVIQGSLGGLAHFSTEHVSTRSSRELKRTKSKSEKRSKTRNRENNGQAQLARTTKTCGQVDPRPGAARVGLMNKMQEFSKL